MLKVNVALPNGRAKLLTLLPSSTVQDVRTMAERAFGKRYLRLITAKNRVLVDPDTTLEAEIQYGECLRALVLQPQLASTLSAFALWCQGRSGTAQSLPAVVQTMVVTVPQFKISSRALNTNHQDGLCSNSGRYICRFLRFRTLAVTVSAVRNRSAPAFAALLCRGRISSAQKGSKGVRQIHGARGCGS